MKNLLDIITNGYYPYFVFVVFPLFLLFYATKFCYVMRINGGFPKFISLNNSIREALKKRTILTICGETRRKTE